MANHRPKSLSELNQVYDKAMQAQRAIKEGSMSLSDEAPASEKPSQNIFDELKQQASQAKKPELYDSQIADIANDFIKRYAKPEQTKPHTAAKELKRPAPSIQSLFHTPVDAQQQENADVPLKLDQPELAATAAVSTASPLKPKAPGSAALPSPSVVFKESEAEPEANDEPAETASEASQEQLRREATAKAQHEAYASPKAEVTPSVRITSTERNDLINEYLRVMSDDDSYSDDDEEYRKPKKGGFWSRMKKRRHGPVPEEPAEESSSVDSEEPESAEDIYSDYAEAEEEAPAAEAPQSEDEAPLSLYDYIEADFDFGEDGEIAEETYVDVSEQATQQEEAHTLEDEPEEVAYPTEPEEDTYPTEPEEGTYPTEPEEGTYPTEPEEGTYPTEPEEDTYPTEPEEGTYPTEPEEGTYPTEPEDIIYPTEEAEEETVCPDREPQEDSPTAGMVFDDVFSVTDESKRSYTGGNWSNALEEDAEQPDEAAEPLPYEETENEAAQDEDFSFNETKKLSPKKKKGSVVSKILLCLALVFLIVCTGLVTVLGNIVAVDTGKLISDKYRVFTAEHDYALSGVNAGDLVITEDYDSYAAEGDSFVYVNHEAQKFMIGKHSGSTYNLVGDVLFIAENEAGRVLVLAEDTLGAIIKTYKGIGAVVSPVSDNYIIIDAVLLVLILIVLLCLIVPKLKKSGKDDTEPSYEEDSSPYSEAQEYPEEADNDEASPDEEEEYDSYDYDTDDIEEGLFSGI